eukprot:GAHX01001758.1.p1 GENE.GAHX01001758.1~~GAHX01001758.1.p1  ORF type:complete len:121 (+),score=20.24 GAHX01001758.1:99-461(+)
MVCDTTKELMRFSKCIIGKPVGNYLRERYIYKTSLYGPVESFKVYNQENLKFNMFMYVMDRYTDIDRPLLVSINNIRNKDKNSVVTGNKVLFYTKNLVKYYIIEKTISGALKYIFGWDKY